jgi:putative transposase
VTEKYSFIDAEYAEIPADAGDAPTVVQMFGWLGVPESGYYDWRSRPQSAASRRRELLKIRIRALFEANNEEYGYRRMRAALARGGEQCSPELVRGLMRELGLEPCQPRPWRHSLTEQDGTAGPIPDLVNRDFTAEKPGCKMVGDIAYIPTWQGWVYLALVIDCATRKIVGWAMDDNYKTPLIIDAISMAARNVDLPEGAIFHSDRGSNDPLTSARRGTVTTNRIVTSHEPAPGCWREIKLQVRLMTRTLSVPVRGVRPLRSCRHGHIADRVGHSRAG